jgi:hypothetical protein
MVTFACGLLALAVLLAFVNQGASRAYWTGFAIVGWAYTLLSISPFVAAHGGSLMTTQALIYGWQQLDVVEPDRPSLNQFSPVDLGDDAEIDQFARLETRYYELLMGFNTPASERYWQSLRRYLLIGQALWSIALGFIAGVASAWLYGRRLRREEAVGR